ncbi:hypothetical protein DFS33DRAFT_1276857 [Desarmillaria ectypa]|nr:hypothetical protein DFS33DRAFT_1276857 [Desarmillaria ectypa]
MSTRTWSNIVWKFIVLISGLLVEIIARCTGTIIAWDGFLQSEQRKQLFIHRKEAFLHSKGQKCHSIFRICFSFLKRNQPQQCRQICLPIHLILPRRGRAKTLLVFIVPSAVLPRILCLSKMQQWDKAVYDKDDDDSNIRSPCPGEPGSLTWAQNSKWRQVPSPGTTDFWLFPYLKSNLKEEHSEEDSDHDEENSDERE